MRRYLLILLRVLSAVVGIYLALSALVYGPWVLYPGKFNEAVAYLILAAISSMVCFAGAVNPKYLSVMSLVVVFYFCIDPYFEYKNRMAALPYCQSLIKNCEKDNLDGTECTKFPSEVENESNAILKYCRSIINGN